MPPPPAKRAGVRLAILSAVLFLSGASALVFQTLWLRLTGLEFGNSVWSAALILSSFMAGLASGNAIAVRWNLRGRRPVRVYSLLELAVALCGSTIVFALPHIGGALRPVFQALWDHQPTLTVVRFALTFLILLVPATAMGLTLPVLLEEPSLRRHTFGHTVGLLYGCNTLGAVAGVLGAEMFLVGAFGLAGTALAAGAMSATAAVLAWLLGRFEPEDSSVAQAQLSERELPRPEIRTAARGIAGETGISAARLLGCAFGCGLLLLCLEVVWFRFLRLYVASTSTAFAVMLAVILAGIGGGGLVAGIALRRLQRPERLLAHLLAAAAILTLVSYMFFPIPALESGSGALNGEAWSRIALLASGLMLPVSAISGMLFPAIMAAVQAGGRDRMKTAGAVTLVNTLGAAIGPLLAAFLLLPRFGFQPSVILCALGYAGLAVLASESRHWSVRRWEGGVFLGLAVLVGFALAVFPYRRDEQHFANALRPYEADGSRLQARVEGTADTLQLLRRDLFGRPYYYRLVTNNYSMSATHPRSQRYMRLFSYLPLTLRPESTDALLICYGVGVTADALTRDRDLRHIDIVDISKEVFALAGQYAVADGSAPLRDPRVSAMVQDGRFFLQACPRRYDVITGEPPPLKTAGTVNLYTREFFSLLRSRLKDGGIASFWLPIYQLEVAETKAILRAFHEVFPNASVWGGADGEWIMLGINGPGRALEPAEIRRWWNDPATRADLGRIGIETDGQLAACFLMDADEIARITAGVAPLTELHPKRLGDASPDLAEVNRFAWTYLQGDAAFRRFHASPLIARIWPHDNREALEPFFDLREMHYLALTKGGNWLDALDLYLRSTRLRGPVEQVLNTDEVRIALAEREARASKQLPVEVLPDLVADALARRDYGGAIRLLESGRARSLTNQNDFFLLIYLYSLTGRVTDAQALAAANPVPRDWFVDWLWNKLRTDFGFRPPA